MEMDINNMHVITQSGEQCFMWQSPQLNYIAQDRQEMPKVLATKFGKLATKLNLSYNTFTSIKNIDMFTNLNELILDNNHLTDDQLDFKQNLRLKTLSLNKNKLCDLHRLISTIKVCFPNLEFLSLIGNPLCPTPILASTGGATTKSLGSSPTSALINHHEADEAVGRYAVDLNNSNGANNCASSYKNDSNQHESNNNNVGLDDDDGWLTAQVIHSRQTEFAYQKYRYFIIYHLPNLRFLDSNPIGDFERDEALKRCCWMEANSNTSFSKANHCNNDNYTTQQHNGRQHCEPARANNSDDSSFQLTIMSDYPSEAESGAQQVAFKGAFTRLSYKYTGKNSEGNRFIKNNDL